VRLLVIAPATVTAPVTLLTLRCERSEPRSVATEFVADPSRPGCAGHLRVRKKISCSISLHGRACLDEMVFNEITGSRPVMERK